MILRSISISISIAAASAVALVPSRAAACSLEACERIVDVELAQATIPAGEAVVVLRPVLAPPELFPTFDPAKALEAVTVTVTLGEEAVPGELVARDELELLVWQPGAPLAADSTYEVTVVVDNAMLGYPECGSDGFSRVFQVETEAAAAVPLVVPGVTTAAAVTVVPWLRPETMVCCDGAFPFDASGECGPAVEWSQGSCAAGSGVAWLDVTASLDPAAVAAARGQIGYHFSGEPFVPGANELVLRSKAPLCGSLTAIHLGTGEVMTGPEVCAGQELAGMLGEVALDPAPGLAMCAGQPYTCAVDTSMPWETLWDQDDCATWPEGQATTGAPTTGDASTGGGGASDGTDGDASAGAGGEPGEKGCACAAGPAGPPWWLAGLVVLLLPRRRRATRR